MSPQVKRLRIALVEALDADGWSAGPGRFKAVADILAARGHDVFMIDGTAAGRDADGNDTAPPILTGLNRAVAARPMIDSHWTAHRLAKLDPDIIVAPLRGGLAQGALMARACGEAFGETRIALWCDQPSRARFLAGDDLSSGLAPLLADALEHQCLMLADALIVPGETGATSAPLVTGETLAGYGMPGADRPIPRYVASLDGASPHDPGPDTAPTPRSSSIDEIVFFGPLRRSGGVVEFIEAIERLVRAGHLGDRLVTFLGPIRDTAPGIGKEWLGLRAAAWSFRFRVIEESDRNRVRAHMDGPGRLAVGISDDPDELAYFRACGDGAIALSPGRTSDIALTVRIEKALRDRLEGGRPPGGNSGGDGGDGGVEAWPKLLDGLKVSTGPRGGSGAGAGRITVCVLHFNRLALLREALASIPHEVEGQIVEVIVIDNATPRSDIVAEIHRLAGGRPLLRVLALSHPVSPAAAYNRGLAEASFDTVLFLDDDNVFAPDGVRRLARAPAVGDWDIVVTSLDVFDGDSASGSATDAPSAGRLIFLGMAHSAGLFFNAFGDTAMAVRRDRFLALGGFHDPGHLYPCLDWVTLAKAQASGLRIGALQWPAVRYRRDTERADLAANKLDQEGARTFVFEAFGNSFDPALVARYAQKLDLLDR